jgi:hypothetical protein
MKDFRDLLHNPRLYYVIVPLVCALWPAYAGFYGLHSSNANWTRESTSWQDAQKTISEILQYDPDHLKSKQNKGVEEFSFPNVVDQVARSVSISSASYKLQTAPITKTQGGKESQDASITLRQIDLATFAKFLSNMQLQGANVQCTRIKLTKQKGAADMWNADMTIKYFRG